MRRDRLVLLGMFTVAAAGVAWAIGTTRAEVDDQATRHAPAAVRSAASTTTTRPQPTTTLPRVPTNQRRLQLVQTIGGQIEPKSVVASGTGVVFAQNMMYKHTVTVYDEAGQLVKTIPDSVDLAEFGVTGYPPGEVQGSPVEVAFSPDAAKAYVSNYSMFGPGFGRYGADDCPGPAGLDTSFVYRVDVGRLAIDQVIPVGTVPKYVATSPDGKLVLVSNWCSDDLSVIDVAAGREVQRIPLGRHPRGIVVDPTSTTAYVAIQGGSDIRTVDLRTFTPGRTLHVGRLPRHLVLSPDGKTLYVSLNGEGQIAKLDVASGQITGRVATGSQPRSMDVSSDGQSLYVVNYRSNTMSKVQAADMRVLQEVPTRPDCRPIGVTYDTKTGRIWMSCYSGSILVFDEM
jgi:YVTN family beta-propeller protein